jgi:hypothetical protein
MKNEMTEKSDTVLTQQSKRQFLRNLAGLIGASAVVQLTSGNALAEAFSYKANTDSAKQAGKVFSQYQMKTLANICAVVLPKTDTPSASELDVHGFIDHQLAVCYDKKQQQQAIDIIDEIDQKSQQHFSTVFTQLPFEQKTQLLVALEERNLGFSSISKQQFKALKSLLVFGYFTTEVGATQALSYQAIPGGFKGSIPYNSVGKSYGSLAYY